jgi:hypothetical protein
MIHNDADADDYYYYLQKKKVKLKNGRALVNKVINFYVL